MHARQTITESQLTRLSRITWHWQLIQHQQETIVQETASILGCSVYEAMEILDRDQDQQVIDRNGKEKPSGPTLLVIEDELIDSQTWLAWGLMAGGFAAVALGCWWFYGG